MPFERDERHLVTTKGAFGLDKRSRRLEEPSTAADEATRDGDGCTGGLIGAIATLDKWLTEAKEAIGQPMEGSMKMAALPAQQNIVK